MFILLLLILISNENINGVHFNGGTITWSPVDPYTNSSPIIVTIIQTYTWTLSSVNCDINVPISTPARINENNNLTCVGNCSNQGNYINSVISILTDCISTSPPINLMKSQKAKNVTLDPETYFSIAYRDSSWRSLANSAGVYWSILSFIDLRRRPDGIINSSPISNVQSPQYVIVNKTTQIRIPVFDINQQDHLRCRWANKSTNLDECDGVCYSYKMPNGTNLTDCVLTFTGTVPGAWYAIALQIEDFFDSTSIQPMSSIPVQFLIHILPIPKCTQLPMILPLDHCLIVEVNIPIQFNIYIINYCNNTDTIITDLSITIQINQMNYTRLFNSTTNSSLSYKIFNWIPQINQIGLQHLCSIAYTNEMTQSQEYCVAFNVTSANSPCIETTTSTTTSITTSLSSTVTITTPPSSSTTIITTSPSSTTTTMNETNTTVLFITSSTEIKSETTTISRNIDMPLIVSLSLLALLLSICCCCCCLWWLYYYYRVYDKHHRKHVLKGKLNDRNDFLNNQIDLHKCSKMIFLRNESSIRSFGYNNHLINSMKKEEILPVQRIDQLRRTSKEEDSSIYQLNLDETISKLRQSTNSICPLNKSSISLNRQSFDEKKRSKSVSTVTVTKLRKISKKSRIKPIICSIKTFQSIT